MLRNLGSGVALLLAALMAAGCTVDPLRSPLTVLPDHQVAEEVWRFDEGTVLSQVAVVDDTVVHYARIDGAVFLIALSAQDGKERWRKRIRLTGENALAPVVGEGVVAQAVPAGKGRRRIHLLDARTGRKVAETRRAFDSRGWPETCPGQEQQVCVGEGAVGSDGEKYFRLDVATAKLTELTARYPDQIAYDFETSRAVARHEGRKSWQRKIGPVPGLGDVSSYYYYGRSGVFLVATRRADTVEWVPDPRPPVAYGGDERSTSHQRVQARNAGVAAFSTAEGDLVWAMKRTAPCRQTHYEVQLEPPRTQLFCRLRKGWYHDTDGGNAKLHFHLVQVDMATGKVLWRGPDQFTHHWPPKTDTDAQGRFVVRAEDGVQLVDPETGDREPATAETVAWRGFDGSYQVGEVSLKLWRIFEPVLPTQRDLRSETVPWPIPDGIGGDAGDLQVIARTGDVVGYRARPVWAPTAAPVADASGSGEQ